MSKEYNLFCNACGNKFKATRDDARTCGSPCRTALRNANKIIKEELEFEEKEEKEKYENSKKSIEGKDEIVKGVKKTIRKDSNVEGEEQEEEESEETEE